jgi:hypothetical protein
MDPDTGHHADEEHYALAAVGSLTDGEIERQQRRFLRRLYAATDGNSSAARAVDVIASDVGLGTKDGYRIARHLVDRGRLRWRAIGVVSVTPAGAEDVAQEADVERRRRLARLVHACDVAAIRAELDRLCDSVATDAEAAITAACAVLETTFKTYITAENIAIPRDQSLRGLWDAVQRHLRVVSSPAFDEDVKRVLSGLSVVVDGVARFSTNAREAHLRGEEDGRLEPFYAALAVRAAYTVVTFVVERLTARANE